MNRWIRHIFFLLAMALPMSVVSCAASGSGSESVFKYAPVFKVAQFGLYECRPFSRFDMLEPYDRTWFAIEIKIKSVFKISCSCHKCYMF